MYALFILSLCIILTVFGQTFMKTGMNEVGKINLRELLSFDKLPSVFLNKFVLAGCFAYLIALVLWLVALSRLDLSYMYPLISVSYVLTALSAFIFLGERVTMLRWSGTFLIFAGSYLIMRS